MSVMVEMVIPSPLIIGSRLMAAYKVDGLGTFHIAPLGRDEEGSITYRVIIDDVDGKELLDDSSLRGGGGNDVMLLAILDSFLGFLGAAADAYRHDMSNPMVKSENSNLFPPEVMEWAYVNSEEIGMAQFELTYIEHAEELEDDEPLPPCVSCGVRPWGFGYCGEECEACAAMPS